MVTLEKVIREKVMNWSTYPKAYANLYVHRNTFRQKEKSFMKQIATNLLLFKQQ